ncbi:hypothetical protein ACJX0J_009805, partial [Zea mays]
MYTVSKIVVIAVTTEQLQHYLLEWAHHFPDFICYQLTLCLINCTRIGPSFMLSGRIQRMRRRRAFVYLFLFRAEAHLQLSDLSTSILSRSWVKLRSHFKALHTRPCFLNNFLVIHSLIH